MQVNETKQKRFGAISPIWIAPLMAVVIALILVWHNVVSKGPVVEIHMDQIDSIVAGKTEVKFRSVKVGIVQKIRLTSDFKRVVATIQMDPGTENLLREDSAFWLVKPRLSVGQVSGLDTLFSGAYLQLYRGSSEKTGVSYELSKTEPLNSADHPGRKLVLRTASSKQLNAGDPILYAGFEAGKIQNVTFDVNSGYVSYEVFINDPYTKFIDSSTLFYQYGGVDISASVTGLKVNIDSLEHIIRGGVVMLHDSANKNIELVDESHIFELYATKALAENARYKDSPSYVVYVDKEKSGIEVGNKVYINGMVVGEVTDVGWFDNENFIFSESLMPVRLRINSGDKRFVKHLFQDKLSKGLLCAELESTSIFSENDVISLNIRQKLSCQRGPQQVFRGLTVIPTLRKNNIIDVFTSLSKDLMALDLKGLSRETVQLLKSLNKLTENLSKTTDDLNQLKTVQKISDTVDQLGKTMSGYRPETKMYENLEGVVSDMKQILHLIKPMMREMEQKTNALVFENTKGDMIPRAGGR